MKKIALAMCAGCFGLAFSSGALALEDLKPYYIAIEGSDLDLTLYADDSDDSPTRIDDEPKTIRVRAGWNWNDNASVELIYGEGAGEKLDFNDRSLGFENNSDGSTDTYGPVSGSLERLTGVYFRYGGFALFDGLKLSGILGYTYRPRITLDFENSPAGPFSLDEELESDLAYGFAATYYINKSFALHFDWMMYAEDKVTFDNPTFDPNDVNSPSTRTIDYRLDGISFGLSLSFGETEED